VMGNQRKLIITQPPIWRARDGAVGTDGMVKRPSS
jgi:hypothetical protein